MTKKESFRAGIFLFTCMFTFLASNSFKPFRCMRQVDGTYSMIANPSENCFESRWNKNIGIAVLSIITYILFIPLYIMRDLYKARKNVHNRAFVLAYGGLITAYKEKYYYWECFSILKKTFLVMLIDLLGNEDSISRIYYVVMVLILSMAVEYVSWPFDTKILNGLNTG
jgi:hypothetical protein